MDKIICQHCNKLMPLNCENCPNCGKKNTIGPLCNHLKNSSNLEDKFMLMHLMDQNRCPHKHKSYSDGRYYCDDCGEDLGSPWDC